MIKRYHEFIKENNYMSEPPGPGKDDVLCVSISDQEMTLIENEPLLSGLISGQQISVVDNKLYYWDDRKVIQVLNQFFPEKIVDTLEPQDLVTGKGHVDIR